VDIAKPAGFGRAAPGVVLGIKVQDNDVFGDDVGQCYQLAGLVRQ
jgi:hypothetical protein